MKLHPSHQMGTIEGVKCCMRCYVEPWWPLAEQRCGGSLDDRERERAAKNKARISARRAAAK